VLRNVCVLPPTSYGVTTHKMSTLNILRVSTGGKVTNIFICWEAELPSLILSKQMNRGARTVVCFVFEYIATFALSKHSAEISLTPCSCALSLCVSLYTRLE
jgi:hypothetical protein